MRLPFRLDRPRRRRLILRLSRNAQALALQILALEIRASRNVPTGFHCTVFAKATTGRRFPIGRAM